jgi:hypothetical protein
VKWKPYIGFSATRTECDEHVTFGAAARVPATEVIRKGKATKPTEFGKRKSLSRGGSQAPSPERAYRQLAQLTQRREARSACGQYATLLRVLRSISACKKPA